MEELTFWEFRSWMYRLHTKFPRIYTRKKQYELCWLVSGMPAEWFRERAKYVHMSNHGKFDWKKAAREKRVSMSRPKEFLRMVSAASLGPEDQLKARSTRMLILDDVEMEPMQLAPGRFEILPEQVLEQTHEYLTFVPTEDQRKALEQHHTQISIGYHVNAPMLDEHDHYDEILKREGVKSVVEILDKKKEVPSEA